MSKGLQACEECGDGTFTQPCSLCQADKVMSKPRKNTSAGKQYLLLVGEKELAILRMALRDVEIPDGDHAFTWGDVVCVKSRLNQDLQDTQADVNSVVNDLTVIS